MLPEDWESADASDRPSTASPAAAETTGRWVVTFADGTGATEAIAALRSLGVSSVVSSADFDHRAVDVSRIGAEDAVVFTELGVAVVAADPTMMGAVRTAVDSGIVAVEPEYVHHVLQETQSFQDTAEFTWGLQATGVSSAPFSGAGIKVAVLDTGFDFNHPDFAGRTITSESFVSGAATAQDGHGHGTHCIGTACGPLNPPSGVRRYGCAYEADIFVGKVLSDQGSGTDTSILAGINWAVANGTEVISMSLGADVAAVSAAYEAVGRRALDSGCLIVAAAGNNAHRDQPSLPPLQRYGFVGIPANSPSIMAIAALDEQLDIAVFSARSLANVDGGNIDLAGPGVRVFSSWNQPRPEQDNQKYRIISGTSMATPHAAGVAALWSQARAIKGWELWATLGQHAQRLTLPSVDVGSGLVQAPQ